MTAKIVEQISIHRVLLLCIAAILAPFIPLAATIMILVVAGVLLYTSESRTIQIPEEHPKQFIVKGEVRMTTVKPYTRRVGNTGRKKKVHIDDSVVSPTVESEIPRYADYTHVND